MWLQLSQTWFLGTERQSAVPRCEVSVIRKYFNGLACIGKFYGKNVPNFVPQRIKRPSKDN
jgi:hypothetical protein